MTELALRPHLDGMLRRRVAGCQGLLSAERLSGGANQETYRLVIATDRGERRLCLRRAAGGTGHHQSHAPGLATEALLMQVAHAAQVPEPAILHVLEAEDGLGEGFLMEWLDGETLGAKIARGPDFAGVRPRLARQCGEILARIHAIDLDATGLRQRLETVTPAAFVRDKWLRYQSFDTPQPMIDYTARWLLEHLPQDDRLTLVHNDFRNGNLMVDASGIRAVLDWEIAHIGSPLRDLGWLCTRSWRFGVSDKPVGGFGDYEDLIAGYEAVSGHCVDRAALHFWEVFGSFWWAVECLGMAEHYRNGPDKTVERPAIGRRSSECQVDCVNLLIPGPVELVGAEADEDTDMPRIDELLLSVREFLQRDVRQACAGRTNFLARVGGNSLDIVRRELSLGPAHRRAEHARLARLLGHEDSLATLRQALCERLREGLALDAPGLTEHLRLTVVNQVAIDQPSYHGLATALAHSRPG